MNLMRRILTYYFLQFPRHRGNIYHDMLVKNRDKFITKTPNGRTEETLCRLAASMHAYLSDNPFAAIKGFQAAEHAYIETYWQVFKQIFEALSQDQHSHYIMMSDRA